MRGHTFVLIARSAEVVIAFGLSLAISGCHSALFQTARVQQGTSATVGITGVSTGKSMGASDYSVFLKVEIGREGSPSRFGYSLATTAITPMKSPIISGDGKGTDSGSYPNQYAAFFPEFKLQFPQRLAFDIALDLRLAAYIPERICLILSRQMGNWASVYTSIGYEGVIRALWVGGVRIAVNQNLALLVEKSIWLSKHQYPIGFENAYPRPHSTGFAISLTPSIRPKPLPPGVAYSLATE
ncbi:MAG: hypothetical protein ACUVUU_05440 [bacterium]